MCAVVVLIVLEFTQFSVEIVEGTVAGIEGRLIDEHGNEGAQDDVAALVTQGERQHGLKVVRPSISFATIYCN